MKQRVAFIVASALLVCAMPASAGSAAAGKAAYAAKGCIGCHGVDGNSSTPTYPSLVGKRADYIKQLLTEYRSGQRVSESGGTMNAMAAGLSDKDIADLSAYLGTL